MFSSRFLNCAKLKKIDIKKIYRISATNLLFYSGTKYLKFNFMQNQCFTSSAFTGLYE